MHLDRQSLSVFAQQKKLKLNLNSRLVVIFVLRLAKPLSENTKQNRQAKVSHTHCSQYRLPARNDSDVTETRRKS